MSCWVKLCTEKLKTARRKLLNLRNKHSIFIPNAAIFILERNLIGGRFWSRARQPLLSRKRVSRNQQNINCNFHQGLCKHFITLEPQAYLFFSKSLSFSCLFAKFSVRLLCGSKRETPMVSQKIQLGTIVRKVWRQCGSLKRFGPFFYDERKAGQDKMFILT